MVLLSKVKLDGPLPFWVTRTFPDVVPSASDVNRIELVFWMKLVRRFPEAAEVWRRELQQRKSGEVSRGKWVPHFHSLIWNCPVRFDYCEERGQWATVKHGEDGLWVETIYALDGQGQKVVACQNRIAEGGQDRFKEWLSRNWYEAVGSGDIRHFWAGTSFAALKEAGGVRYYVSKYQAKQDAAGCADCLYVGARAWGARGAKRLPLGERVVIPCSYPVPCALSRAARRYARRSSRKPLRFGFRNVFVNDTAQWLRLLAYLVKEHEAPF
jgi:hypothetical protein